tara:strand:+ start:1005 stop:1523 length:519 start_codon:yes stop_codon:yes gene_type:complete
MKIKFIPSFLIVIFIFIFIFLYKGLNNSSIYVPNSNLNKKIPNFSAKEFKTNMEINSLDIFVGDEFYILNIWASWCIPCKTEHPFLVNLSKQENLKIIGLNYKDKIDNAKSFLSELQNPYDIIFLDNDGTIAIEWGAYGVPETFLINKKSIIKKIIGPITNDTMTEIKELIK